MTALAVALVLCCAMVCGLRVYDLKHNERLRAGLEKSRDWHGLSIRVESIVTRLDEWERKRDGDVSALRSELETLRAQVALRSV